MTTLLARLLKALLPRCLFLGHGTICILLVVELENDPRYWYLMACLGLLVIEGILNAVYRRGRELDWLCPSAFLYCVVVITVLSTYRSREVKCILTEGSDAACSTRITGSNSMIQLLSGLPVGSRASVIEQTALLVLIVGRWLLPKGSISREQFSQILLIYVGTAADIVEFSEIYGEDDVRKLGDHREEIYDGVMIVWGWSVLQFSLTIALPEEGLKTKGEDGDDEENDAEIKWHQTQRVVPMSYMHYKSMLRQGWGTDKVHSGAEVKRGMEWRGKYEFRPRRQTPGSRESELYNKDHVTGPGQTIDAAGDLDPEETGCGIKRRDLKNCVYKHMELITCLIPMVMQDGPFFVFRVVLIARYGVVTELIILLTCKNALVIIVQMYRILVIYCVEPREKEPDIEDPSVRVRTAMGASHRLSERPFRATGGSIAIHAITRLQAQMLQKKHAELQGKDTSVVTKNNNAQSN